MMMIPHIGILKVHNNLVAVAFDDNLLKTAKVFIHDFISYLP